MVVSKSLWIIFLSYHIPLGNGPGVSHRRKNIRTFPPLCSLSNKWTETQVLPSGHTPFQLGYSPSAISLEFSAKGYRGREIKGYSLQDLVGFMMEYVSSGDRFELRLGKWVGITLTQHNILQKGHCRPKLGGRVFLYLSVTYPPTPSPQAGPHC